MWLNKPPKPTKTDNMATTTERKTKKCAFHGEGSKYCRSFDFEVSVLSSRGLLNTITKLVHLLPLLLSLINIIYAWIRNHTPRGVWDGLTYPTSLKFGNGWVTATQHYNVCNYFSMLAFKSVEISTTKNDEALTTTIYLYNYSHELVTRYCCPLLYWGCAVG